MSALAAAAAGPESLVAARWARGVRPPVRLADGRNLRVIFPGVPGGGAGPDFTGAVIEIDGDLVRGDVEIHVAPAGWAAHGHTGDPAYAGVVLQVVAFAAPGAACVRHASGRAIPMVVLPPDAGGPVAAGVTPPCSLRRQAPEAVVDALARLGDRRLRAKATRASAALAAEGPGQVLYALALEQLGGGANRAAFAALARQLPLAALVERIHGAGVTPARAAEAELRLAAARLILRRAGLRPLSGPEGRLLLAAGLVAKLWAEGQSGWPTALTPEAAFAAVRAAGLSRGLAAEVIVNAVAPVALAGQIWPEAAAVAAVAALPSPGTYGKLRSLERWLGGPEARPFASARALQGGLALHADYCTKGACGRCPLSS